MREELLGRDEVARPRGRVSDCSEFRAQAEWVRRPDGAGRDEESARGCRGVSPRVDDESATCGVVGRHVCGCAGERAERGISSDGRGGAAEQIFELDRDICLFDGSAGDRDLAETAAQMATLDLVITTDTCIAHLAGAMATTVWILLPHLADCRWGNEGRQLPGTRAHGSIGRRFRGIGRGC